MKYKLKSGGIIKFQNAGSLPRWMKNLNSWFSGIPNSDESAGERILNSTIEQANAASTQEERDQIYKDSAKKNLAVTGQSLMMIPMLNEFATYGLLGGGIRLGTEIAGAKAGEYVLGKGGDWVDKQLDTKFLGTTGRIIGGALGWLGGSNATTPLFRNLAGKGIKFKMPEQTYRNLRGQYNENLRNKLIKKYNSFVDDANIPYNKELIELKRLGPEFAPQLEGYKHLPENATLEETMAQIRETMTRHNQFARGVHGEGLTEEQLMNALLHGPNGNAWVSSFPQYAGTYGNYIGLVQRPVKFGRNPLKWIDQNNFKLAGYNTRLWNRPDSFKTWWDPKSTHGYHNEILINNPEGANNLQFVKWLRTDADPFIELPENVTSLNWRTYK